MRIVEFFQEDCGQLSMSRLLAFIVVMTCLLLAVAEALEKGSIPDIPEGWYWLAALPYGVNRAGAAIQGILTPKKEAPKP